MNIFSLGLGLIALILMASCSSARYGHLPRATKNTKHIAHQFRAVNAVADHKNQKEFVSKEEQPLSQSVVLGKSPSITCASLLENAQRSTSHATGFRSTEKKVMNFHPLQVSRELKEQVNFNNPKAEKRKSSGNGAYVFLGILLIVGFFALLLWLGVSWGQIILYLLLGLAVAVLFALIVASA